jgi:hypothetical protein
MQVDTALKTMDVVWPHYRKEAFFSNHWAALCDGLTCFQFSIYLIQPTFAPANGCLWFWDEMEEEEKEEEKEEVVPRISSRRYSSKRAPGFLSLHSERKRK